MSSADQDDEMVIAIHNCKVCNIDISKANPALIKRNICSSCDFFYLIQTGRIKNKAKVLKCKFNQNCDIITPISHLQNFCVFCRYKKCSGTTNLYIYFF